MKANFRFVARNVSCFVSKGESGVFSYKMETDKKENKIMGNSNLKDLAKKAKDRLKTVGASIEAGKNPATKTAALSNHEYALIATRVKVEDDPLFNKVSRLLAKNPDTPRPLGELIDHKEYDLLSESGKEKYVLNLSARFLKIKNKLCSQTI